MLYKFFNFLDENQWACWAGIALCIAAVGAIEASPTFPYNLTSGGGAA